MQQGLHALGKNSDTKAINYLAVPMNRHTHRQNWFSSYRSDKHVGQHRGVGREYLLQLRGSASLRQRLAKGAQGIHVLSSTRIDQNVVVFILKRQHYLGALIKGCKITRHQRTRSRQHAKA